MEIEKLARKLEPLRPDEVRHWLRARDTANSELRSLVDQQIVTTAHEVLGDFRGTPFLSLPPRNTARGAISLGTVLYEREKWPWGLSEGELLQNFALFGRSGAGKTNVTFLLLEQLMKRKIPFLFLDWKRTARHLIPKMGKSVTVHTPGRSLSPLPFNPFIAPPGIEERVYIGQVVDVMSNAYTLGDGARSLLQKALAKCSVEMGKAPTVEEVIQEVENVQDRERVRGWKTTALRALESLKNSALGSTDGVSQERMARSLLQGNTIIELDALDQGSKAFLIPLLCLWLYSVRLAAPDRERLRLVIFIEEAHHVLHRREGRAKESLMEMLLRQCREIGIGIVVVDQHPHLMSSAALGNTFTSICLNLKDPADFNRAASLSLVEDEDKRCFSQLPVGQGVVKLQDRWRRPFLVGFPRVEVRKGAMTDALLKRYLSGEITLSGLRGAVGRESGQRGRFRIGDTPLSERELAFVEDVLVFKGDGVDRRYKRLGWSGDRGNRVKRDLLDKRVLESETVSVGRTRKVLLRLTVDAKREMGLARAPDTRESLAHEYWKRHWAEKYRKIGYKVTLEAPRPNGRGRMDMLATRANESVAIEVETGKSDVVKNVKEDLLAGVGKVVVVATSPLTGKHVEWDLASSRLLIPGRVSLCERDKFPPGLFPTE